MKTDSLVDIAVYIDNNNFMVLLKYFMDSMPITGIYRTDGMSYIHFKYDMKKNPMNLTSNFNTNIHIPNTNIVFIVFIVNETSQIVQCINNKLVGNGIIRTSDIPPSIVPKFFYESRYNIDIKKFFKSICDHECALTDTALARITAMVMKNRYIYDPILDNWYYLNDYGRYVKEPKKPLKIKKFINTKVSDVADNYFVNEKNNLKKKVIGLKEYLHDDKLSESDKGNINKSIKDIEEQLKFIKQTYCQCNSRLLNNKSVNCIIESLETILCDTELVKQLDIKSKHLIGFNNGVYDLDRNVFRLSRPNEYISKTVGYDYIGREKVEHATLNVMNILRECFETEEQFQYVLGSIALCLGCITQDETFYIWIGDGRNGKGLHDTLIKRVFGEYYGTMTPKYLSGKILSNHDNEIVDKMGKRIIICSEPIVNTKGEVDADISFLKRLGGMDEQKGRKSHGVDDVSYIPLYKLFILTNNYIKFPGADDGISKKIRNVVFPYNFRKEGEDYDPNNKYHKKCNPELKERIFEWNEKEDKTFTIQAYMQILIDKYIELKAKNFKLDVPKEYLEMHNDYVAENDPVQDFIDNNLHKTGNEKDTISSSDMFQAYRNNFPNNVVGQQLFKETMTRKGIVWKRTSAIRCYVGVKLKNDIDFIPD